jgi:glycosyltransferase involved in cell wall biosynthesis
VHILPSWFETTGLSSLEAAAMGCNVVITNRGDAKEYFKSEAWYCDPDSPQSIYDAVEAAAGSVFNEALRIRIHENYTWKTAAALTFNVYKETLKNIFSENRNIRNKGNSESLRRF